MRSRGLLLICLALASCATGEGARRWEDPAVHSLRLAVSRDVVADPPELEREAQLFRTAVVRSLQSRGFRLPDATGADASLRISVRRADAGVAARGELFARSGEVVEDLTLTGPASELEALAGRMVEKLELSASVQTLAHTGVVAPPN